MSIILLLKEIEKLKILLDNKFIFVLAKSPILSHISSSMNGITTIRASNAETILKYEFDKHQVRSIKFYYNEFILAKSFCCKGCSQLNVVPSFGLLLGIWFVVGPLVSILHCMPNNNFYYYE